MRLDRASPNFDDRGGRAVDLVVLHYTGMADSETAIARLVDPAPCAGRYPGPWQDPAIDPETPLARVSAHYVVDEAGVVFRLVPEDARAWHAGVSTWEGEANVNARSIGIEIANGGHDFGLPPFADAQIEAVIGLLQDILARRGLSPTRVVGHSDVAPGRKADPGERFPWARLAAAGVSIWPDDAAVPGLAPLAPGESGAAVRALQARLAAFGYGLDQSGLYDAATEAVVTAFQRRFHPERLSGQADLETLRRLWRVTG